MSTYLSQQDSHKRKVAQVDEASAVKCIDEASSQHDEQKEELEPNAPPLQLILLSARYID